VAESAGPVVHDHLGDAVAPLTGQRRQVPVHARPELQRLHDLGAKHLQRTAVVVDADAADPREQPVGDDRRHMAGQERILAVLAPAAHDIELARQRQHARNVVRIVLEIAVGGDDQAAARLPESGGEGGGLAKVAHEPNHTDPRIPRLNRRQPLERPVLAAIVDEPSNMPGDGGVIRPEFDAELDELRELANSGKQTIASFEALERERTGIATLKVRFNNVFGYYIEISKAQLTKVPDNYERRQTLANAERFTTPELKEWEQKVRGAEDRISQIEADLFRKVVETVRGETKRLLSTARAIATLDGIASLSECATRRNFVAPLLHDGDEIEIKNGRHAIVEAGIDGEFVPNDAYLNNSTDRLLIVTGANMGGKSTILRQIALIQILAQIGSFVPASSARLPIVDRIWTRVGASDDLASGRSTFMVEMTETAAILHNATARSLILLDEIGRGTSTFDGLSIAWAVAEYLHDSSEHSAKTLFATHYHELTELAEHLPGAKNYQITATERNGEVAFLHKLQPGKASKSYGIAVAKLAGLPMKVIERAKDVLTKLEKYELAVFKQEKQSGLSAAAGRSAASQVSLFAIANENVIDQLRAVNVENLSPEDSKALLAEIRKNLN